MLSGVRRERAVSPVTLGRLCPAAPPGSWRRSASQASGCSSASTLASSVGTLLAAIALAIDVKDRTNSGLWVSAVLIVEFLPAIVVGLTLGPLLDRLERRKLMIAADLVRAAVFAALPFATSAGTIVALALVAGLATGFFRPAVYAGVPNLVAGRAARDANALLQTVENVAWAVGPLLGGVLTAAVGPARSRTGSTRSRSSSLRCSSRAFRRGCCRARSR